MVGREVHENALEVEGAPNTRSSRIVGARRFPRALSSPRVARRRLLRVVRRGDGAIGASTLASSRLQAEEEVALEGYLGKSIAFLDKIDGQGWVRDPRPPPGFHPA